MTGQASLLPFHTNWDKMSYSFVVFSNEVQPLDPNSAVPGSLGAALSKPIILTFLCFRNKNQAPLTTKKGHSLSVK